MMVARVLLVPLTHSFMFFLLIQGIEEEDVSPGFVLCDASQPIKTGRKFDAQVVILEHKSIICAGYSAVMHIHCAAEEITVNVSTVLWLGRCDRIQI